MPAPLNRKRWPRVVSIALAAVVLLLVVARFVAGSYLTRAARAQAETLSREWGRPVEVGGVAVTLLTGAGGRATGLRIGAAAGEELPLLELASVEVKVALLRALLSGGKEVEIRSAVASGLRVNVVRLQDGSTNVERLLRKLEKPRPQPVPPEAPRPATDLSFVRVNRAALEGARIAFVDRSATRSREVSVDHLDAEVRDLQVGRPLALMVRAAVLSERPNLELRLQSAPLPPTLVPVPERLTVKLEPVDLAPLAPFLPAKVGLRAGRVQADFDAVLGAAVPGGNGPTRVQGAAKASGLSFAAQQNAKPLEVLFEADLDADAAAGDLRIGKLRLDLGPAGLVGRGSATGLTGGSPRIDGLEIVSHDLDPALLAAYYAPLRDLASRISGPIGFALRGSGTEANPLLEVQVDLTPVRLALPGALAKAPGAKAGLTAHVGGAGKGALRFDADADLVGVDLRPSESFAKAPGDRLQMRLAGTRRLSGDGQQIDISKLEVLLPGGDAASGKATVTREGSRTRFDAQLASEHLDVDRLLLPAKAEATPAVSSPLAPGPGAREERKKVSKPLDPKLFAGLSGRATARIGLVRARKADLRNVVAQIRMQEDEIVVDRAQLHAFGGEVAADGSRFKLAHPAEPFHVEAKAKGVDVGAAVGVFSAQKIVSGRFDGQLDAAGGGQTKASLAETLAGALGGNLSGGVFHGKDLVAGVAGPLARAIPFGVASKEGKGAETSLGKDLPFKIKFQNGVAQLEKPIEISQPQANISIGGGFRLDGSLDLAGTVALAPETVARITGGRVRPQGFIPVTYRLTGPASSPTLRDLGLASAVQAIVKEAGAAALGRSLGIPSGQPPDAKGKPQEPGKRIEEEAKKKLEGLFR